MLVGDKVVFGGGDGRRLETCWKALLERASQLFFP